MATPQPRVLDLTGSRAPRPIVEVVAAPVVDFLVSIVTFGSPEGAHTYDVGPEWFDAVRTTASPRLLGRLERVRPIAWGNLVALALAGEHGGDVPSLLEALRALPAEDLWTELLGGRIAPISERAGPQVFARAARGDQDARELVRETLRALACDLVERGGLQLLDTPPAAVKDLVLQVLRGWYREVYAQGERPAADVLSRDAEAKRRMHRSGSDEELVMAATNGLEFEVDPWTRRVVLTPHLAMRPWNVMCARDDVLVICYPVADESLEEDRQAPPARLLRLYKALADDKRLRILKLLERRRLTLQEIADAVGLAKSSTHHHMVVLRAAGLVSVTLADEGRYALRREAVPEASARLAAFLEGGTA